MSTCSTGMRVVFALAADLVDAFADQMRTAIDQPRIDLHQRRAGIDLLRGIAAVEHAADADQRDASLSITRAEPRAAEIGFVTVKSEPARGKSESGASPSWGVTQGAWNKRAPWKFLSYPHLEQKCAASDRLPVCPVKRRWREPSLSRLPRCRFCSSTRTDL